MSDITAIFGILLTLGIAFPGMLTTWWTLFPDAVERARLRLEETPWSTLWMGIGAALLSALPILVLVALPFGPAKFLGFSLLAVLLAVAGIGAAGLAARMGVVLAQRSAGLSQAGAFVRGAIALELAAVFPVIGWMLVIPLALLVSLGATTFALLKWVPRANKEIPTTIPAASQG
jgi:hypothetical protein